MVRKKWKKREISLMLFFCAAAIRRNSSAIKKRADWDDIGLTITKDFLSLFLCFAYDGKKSFFREITTTTNDLRCVG